MKRLIWLAFLLPYFATAQINGTIQKTVATGTVRGNFGSSGLDTLPRVSGVGINGYLLQYNSATNKYTHLNPANIAGVTTMATIGAVPNANGASISGSTLTLQPASVSFGGLVTTGTQSYAGLKTFTTGIVISSGGLEVTGGGLTVTGTGTSTTLKSSTIGLSTKLENTLAVSSAFIGTLNNGFLAANSSGSTVFEARSDGWLSNPNSGGSGDVLIGSDNSGIFRKVVIGSGLSYSAGTLTATGGTAGTINGSGTAGMITKFTGAGTVGNSIITEATNNISINGADGTNQLDLLSGGNSRMSIGYISSLMQIYSRNLLPIRIGVESGTNGVNITNGGGTDISSNGAPLTLSSLNSNTFKATLRDITTVRGYLGATSTDALVVGSSAAATLMTVNNSTGAVTASSFVGALSGNANTATALQTARTISGTSFDGTANITLNNTGITNGAGYITSSALSPYAPLASPALTGTPTAPTATAGTNTTQLATTAFVQSAVSSSAYTTGTWTPTNSTVGLSFQSGTYRKIGGQVFAYFTFQCGVTANTGILEVTGLPFAPSDNYGSVTIRFQASGGDLYGQILSTGVMRFTNASGTLKTNADLSGININGVAIYYND